MTTFSLSSNFQASYLVEMARISRWGQMAQGLASVAVLVLVLHPVALVCTAEQQQQHCRCFPGETCWPSQDDWRSFNRSVDGGLVATVPLGHVCHDPDYEEEACRELRGRWTDPWTQ